jgi:hypothetical protein
VTELENQLRDAFRAKASEIVPPPPGLELQAWPALRPAASGGSGSAGTSAQRRWLISLAAAVAVVAVMLRATHSWLRNPAHADGPQRAVDE